ncbi:MAG: ABC transporter ATP-binding protein [Hyphomonadaceae bacterium]|nr:ABC transporter ATP-binding protein [Hyphomonadaceae bacterium]
MLSVDGIDAGYGKSQILYGASLKVEQGEAVGLLGRNGAGKTTTLRAIMGLLPISAGAITCHGRRLDGLPTHLVARQGLAMVPEYRGVLAQLTVEENLQIAVRRGTAFGLTDAYALFPRLRERKANSGATLSGGEQQMLAIARCLLAGPRLIILDEPTQGLAPVIVDEMVEAIQGIRRSQQATSLLLVEQNLDVCLALADRHYILEEGHVVHAASTADLAAAPRIQQRYLGVEDGAARAQA